ncbi:MAG: thioredoxin family protein, partial [Chitinophagaceae bacterium]|nr:thioredoxin family protein [Chitinophagaceae bacterium]
MCRTFFTFVCPYQCSMQRFALFFLLLLPSFVEAQSQQLFRDISYKEALEKSSMESKPVFLMCYTSWCGHCKKMKEEVFIDSSLIAYYNANFICIKIDMEAGEGIDLYKKFAVKMYPTFIFLDKNGTTLYRLMGEFKPAEFIDQGKSALTVEKQLPYLQKQFDDDVSNPDKCYAYLMALRRGAMDYTAVASKYFATKKDSDLLNEINWKIIANGVSDINSSQFQFVLTHQKEFSAIASPGRVQRKISNIVTETLAPMVEAKDTASYFRKRPSAAAIHNFKVDSVLFLYDKEIYEHTFNWNGYKNVCLSGAKNFAWNDYHQLHDMADVFYKNIEDMTALSQAALWAQHATVLNPEYSTFIVSARLFQKTGDKTNAISMAQQGKD